MENTSAENKTPDPNRPNELAPVKPFFAMTKLERLCVPVLIGWPIAVYFLPTDVAGPAAFLVYLIIGWATNCLWLCWLPFVGWAVGSSMSPAVFGGTAISRMCAEINRTITGAVLGFFIGLTIQLFKNAARNKIAEISRTKGLREH